MEKKKSCEKLGESDEEWEDARTVHGKTAPFVHGWWLASLAELKEFDGGLRGELFLICEVMWGQVMAKVA